MAKTRQELLLERLRSKYEGSSANNTPTQNQQSVVENHKDDGGFLSNITDYFDRKKQEHEEWEEKADEMGLNWWEKYIGQNLQATRDMSEGLYGAFEGILDAGTGLLAKGADLVGWDKASQGLTDFTQTNLTKEFMYSDFAKKIDKLQLGLTNLGGNGEKIVNAVHNQEMLPPILSDVSKTIGSAVGFIATAGMGGKSKIAQKLLQFASSGGMGLQEALNDGANLDQALGYGALSGATEVATEAIFGGATDDILSGAKKSGKTIIKDIVKDFGEEGLEEAVSDLASPLYKTLTYKQDSSYAEEFQEQGGIEGIVESFLLGGISGGVLGGGNAVASINQAGGMQASNVRDYAYKMAEINDDITKAYKEGNFDKVAELEGKKAEIQEKTKAEFEDFVKKIDETKNKAKKEKQTETKELYTLQSEARNSQILKKSAIEQVAKANKVKVEFDKEGETQATSYDAEKNIIHISDDTLNDNAKYKEVIHEFAHAKSNADLKKKVLEGINNLEQRRAELVKNKGVSDSIRKSKAFASYKELGYDDTTAFDKAKNKILDEEVYANEFAKMFDSLDQFERATVEMDKKGAKKLLDNIRDVFEGRKKPANYKKAVNLLKSTVDGTRDMNERLYASEVEQTQAKIDEKVEYDLNKYNTGAELAKLANELLDKMNAIAYGSFNERSDPDYSLTNLYNDILETKNKEKFDRFKNRVELLEYYYKLAVQVNKKGKDLKGYKSNRDADRNWVAQVTSKKNMDIDNGKKRLESLSEMFQNQDDSIIKLEKKKDELRAELRDIDRRKGSVADSGIKKNEGDSITYQVMISDMINKLDNADNAKAISDELKLYEKTLQTEIDRRTGFLDNKKKLDNEMTAKLNELKNYDKTGIDEATQQTIDSKIADTEKSFKLTKNNDAFKVAEAKLKDLDIAISRAIAEKAKAEEKVYTPKEIKAVQEKYKDKKKEVIALKDKAWKKGTNATNDSYTIEYKNEAIAMLEKAKSDMQEYFKNNFEEDINADETFMLKYNRTLSNIDEKITAIKNSFEAREAIEKEQSKTKKKTSKPIETQQTEEAIPAGTKVETPEAVEKTAETIEKPEKPKKKTTKKEAKKADEKVEIKAEIDITNEVQIEEHYKIIKDSIKVVRVRKASEVKNEADLNREVKYDEKVSRGMMKLISATVCDEGFTRLVYNGKSIEKVYYDIFETMNGEGTIEEKRDKIYAIVKSGLEIKSPHPEIVDGKAGWSKTETYQHIDESAYSGTPTEATIEKKTKGIIEQLLRGSAKTTTLAKAMQRASEMMKEQFEKVQKELNDYIQENLDLHKEIELLEKKIVDQKTTKQERKQLERQLKEAEKRILKLNKKFDGLSEKYTNLKNEKNDFNRLSKELNKQLVKTQVKLEQANMQAAEAQSELGKYKWEDNVAEGINEFVRKAFNLADWDIANDGDFMKRFAKQYSKGYKRAVDMLMNHLLKQEIAIADGDGKYAGVTLKDMLSSETVESLAKTLKEEIVRLQTNGQVAKLEELKQKFAYDMKVATALRKLRREVKKGQKIIKQKGGGVNPEYVAGNIQLTKDIDDLTDAEIMKGELRKVFEQFSKDYNELINKGEIEVPMSDELLSEIEKIVSSKDEVTLEEIEEYENALMGLRKYFITLRHERKIDINGKPYKLQDMSRNGIEESEKIKERLKGKKEAWFGSYFVDPRVVFEKLDGYNEDGTFSKLYQMLEEGDLEFQKMHLKLSNAMNGFITNNKAFKKSFTKEVTINGITATNEQMLQYYETMTDDDGYRHIKEGGIETKSGHVKFESEEKLKEFRKAIADHYKLNDKNSVASQYLDIVDKFLVEAKEVKARVDKDRLGFTNVKKGKYFMLEVADSHFQQELGSEERRTDNMNGYKKVSFNQSRTRSVAPLKATGLHQVIEYRMFQMAMYHGYGNRIDVFNYVYNARLSKDGQSLGKTVRERFGKDGSKYKLDQYLNTLLNDIQGVMPNKDGFSKIVSTTLTKFRKAYSTYQLGANLQTMAKQIGAIPSASKYIKVKYLLQASVKSSKKLPDIPTLAKYRIYQDTYTTQESKSAKTDGLRDWFMKGVRKVDEFTTRRIWTASLLQTQNPNGSWNVVEAEKLFNKTMRETQQSSSALDQSALMRSHDDIVKTLTMFSSEANKQFSNVIEGVERIKYKLAQGLKLNSKDYRLLSGAVSRMLISASVSVVISALFRALREKDDEEDFWAYNGNRLLNEVIGVIPFASNLYIDVTEGFSVEADMSIAAVEETLNTFFEAVNKIIEGEGIQAADKIVEFGGRYLGIPTGNMKTEFLSITKMLAGAVDPLFDTNIKGWLYKNEALVDGKSFSNKAQINTALKKGRTTKAEAYYDEYTDNIMTLTKGTKKELFELYKNGYSESSGKSSSTAYLKTIPNSIIIDNESIEVDKEQFKEVYSQVAPRLDSLVKSSAYDKVSVEGKNKAVALLVNSYYNIAKKELYTKEEYSRLEVLLSSKIGNTTLSKIILNLAEVSLLEATETKSKKKVVQDYINKLKLSKAQKYLIYYLAGYTLNDENTNLVKQHLKVLGLRPSQIKKLLKTEESQLDKGEKW